MILQKGMALIKLVVVVVVLVCMFVTGDDATQVGCIKREREALLSFKDSLIDEYDILSSWRSDDCCKWYGVECENTTGQVVALQLDGNYYDGVLQGKVGSSLLELHHLIILDLSWNDFGGNPIPNFIFSMKQLQELYLGGSNFSGTVPPEIGNLTNLGSLALSYNNFGGNTIPESIGSMKQLQHLYLRSSNFSGIVPPQIRNLTNLRLLSLSYNHLRIGNLDWLSNSLSFLSLSGIDLSHTNKLHHILNLPSLQELQLESCNLTDVSVKVYYPFPNSSYTTSLSILDLKDNQLTCSSFDWLSNMSSSLVKLDLSGNALSGPIPSEYFERGSLTLIEHLDLSSNTLEGEIPKSLWNLSHLRVLVLYDNSLTMGQPFDELFGNLSISGKGILESIKILDLADNRLNGPVPDLRPFSSLTEVLLGGNNFTGSMPLSVGQLSKLQILDLSRNSLEGLVTESHFMKLHSLKVLDLSSNSFIFRADPNWSPSFQLESIFLGGCNAGPSFPKWIKSQSNLRNLDLSRAGIRDEAPKWLWSRSPVLEALILSDNQIGGTIPNLSSTSISEIDVTNNRFSGTIPFFSANAGTVQLGGNMFSGSISSICEVPPRLLHSLDLSNNELGGQVPNCWEKMPNIYSLNLANNSFWGEIPPSLGSLGQLFVLQLRGNNLSGELPSTLRHCQKLQLTDVEGNRLTGEIRAWIGELQYMKFLNLGRNHFHGIIPPETCNLNHIRILDFAVNNLSGEIPDCFNNFTALVRKNITRDTNIFGYAYVLQYDTSLPNIVVLRYYSYSSFQWKGQELEYRKTLAQLRLIDLSSNRLSGEIPETFSCMRGLISLNLSRNSLTGNIIPDIGEMKMLESLDLSHNQLSGEIPASMAQLQYLAVLDLSTNNLFGRIPTSTQLQSFNASAYAGNDGLCGPPLVSCPEDSLRPPSDGKNTNDEKGRIFSFVQEVCISMAFGFILGFWGVVASFVIKRSWRNAYFNLLDAAGDWFYVRTTLFLSKWRPT